MMLLWAGLVLCYTCTVGCVLSVIKNENVMSEEEGACRR
jgi:hypothetical protein